jgi:hypothetical protein
MKEVKLNTLTTLNEVTSNTLDEVTSNTLNEVALNALNEARLNTAMKQVKLNATAIKFTPSSFITYYEVNTNFSVTDESELLTFEEVKAVLNSYKPQVK